MIAKDEIIASYKKICPLMENAPTEWAVSCVHSETSMHQLSPYIGKLKSSIATQLIDEYTKQGQLVVDPFSGSGTIPYQACIMGRNVFCSDLSIYAKLLTRAKLSAPTDLDSALLKAKELLNLSAQLNTPDLNVVPAWVQEFFHPLTLIEILKFATIARRSGNEFFFACFLGILHHQRPGFLSYPASHLTPYLRNTKYPRNKYPQMYEYRDLPTRLFAKIKRAFKHNKPVEGHWEYRPGSIEYVTLPEQFNTLITSPPYMNTLDYGRDNRLRLWFINPDYNKPLDAPATQTRDAFEHAITALAKKIEYGLKNKGYCILIVGEQARGKVEKLSGIIFAIFERHAPTLRLIRVIVDKIPDIRRARRNCKGTKNEHILIFQRVIK